jgi:hypothetical protein
LSTITGGPPAAGSTSKNSGASPPLTNVTVCGTGGAVVGLLKRTVSPARTVNVRGK